MTPERWAKVAELFEIAATRAPNERAAFLNEACAGDDALRREIDALLASDRDGEEAFEEITSRVAAGWATESDADDLLGKTLGRYQILALLGSGGMGEVYLAQDATLDRKVALKLLPQKFTQDRDRLRRFEQEARAASALNHPNIITIHEVGEWEGCRFIATEFVEGETLQAHSGQPRLELTEVLEVGIQASSALAAAHKAGIVHRDIKPANIMLRSDGYIKVLDFGLAKLIGPRANLDATEAGRVMGTINYMSPEQAMGQPLDHRTDIFSLGVVLYEIATGHRLFEGETEGATYDRILHHEPPPMRNFVPALPVELDQVIRRALEKDPARRYQSAADLRADLKRLAQGTGTTEAAILEKRERRAARKSRTLRVAAIAAVLVALISAALFLGHSFTRQDKAPNEPAKKSIAVLPFENLSSDKENAYFADGVQDQVLTDLSKIAELKVIGRSSVLQYKTGAPRDLREIGQQLGVAYLLEGSVQRATGKVRVSAQLTDANTKAQLWAETYDSDLADVFAIQSSIAQSIALQLHAKLSASERAEIATKPTSDVTAFDLYTRGRTLLALAETATENSQENLNTAVVLLNEAVQRDPGFLIAYRQLARAHDALYSTGIDHSPTRLALGQGVVDAAMKVAPNSGEAQLMLATHLYAQRQYEGAEQALNAARQNLPNEPETFALGAYIHRRLGEWKESTRELEKAIDLDPRNALLLQDLAANYHSLHDYRAVVSIWDRIIALTPERLEPRLALATTHLLWRADPAPLHALIEARLKQDPASAGELVHRQLNLAFYERDLDGLAKALALLGDGWYGNDHQKFSRAFGEGMLAQMKGDHAAAQKHFADARIQQEHIVETQRDYAPAISMLGIIDAALGRKEDALREGRRAVELLPVAKDSMTGPAMVWNLAIIAGWVGENDLALEQLRSLLQKPAGPQYGHLKLDPLFDPLRSDPRFEEIVLSLAPADVR